MVESITQAITGFLQHNNNPLGLAILGISALIEYVFPPFPGDTVTLFGAFLVTRFRWSLPLVFGVVMLGSAVGAMADYALGMWLGQRFRQGWLQSRPAVRQKIEQVMAAFVRHGEGYIVFNRFLPAVRAVFFIAAGMARLRAGRVFFFAMLSAAAWNALIIGGGFAVGANWDRLQQLFRTYSLVAWSLVGLALMALITRLLLRRRKKA
jgi:membrane protein DedA with SNARE-associated domain